MHARGQILEAILDALEGATSPATPVFEEDETASGASFQYAVTGEVPVEVTKNANRRRALSLRVSARGATLDEREDLAEALELVLLDGALGDAFDVVLQSVDLSRNGEGGQRVYAATYVFEVQYNTPRGQPGTLA
jgi:ribosomal protein S7